MPRSLSLALGLTDAAFLLYWTLSALAAAGLLSLPPALMYADFDQARVVAWNWSFLPLDIAFSATGLASLLAARRGQPIWRPLALLSLAFTMAAGGMAVAYWTLLGEFTPGWFLPNLAILLWPLLFLPGLMRGSAAEPQHRLRN